MYVSIYLGLTVFKIVCLIECILFCECNCECNCECLKCSMQKLINENVYAGDRPWSYRTKRSYFPKFLENLHFNTGIF